LASIRKIIKKTTLSLIALLLALQVPFIYRRYELGRIASAVAEGDRHRTVRTDAGFDEYKGIIHAHTRLGGHSTGSFDELISGAKEAGVDFVVMTEHWSDDYDTSALTLNGNFGGTLFVGGNEIDTADSDRLLMLPGGAEAASLRRLSTDNVLEKLHAEGRLGMITYPEKFRSWGSDFDGIEVFNLHTAAKQMNWFTAFFDIIWSGRAYPELTFAQYFRRPEADLQRFDASAAQRPRVLFAGTDAHSNLGIHILGDDAGHKWLSLKADPYRASFSAMRVHLLVPKGTQLTRESLMAAIGAGRSFVGIDCFGDTTGFSFTAGDRTLGDELRYSEGMSLDAAVPLPAKIAVMKDGALFAEFDNTAQASVNPDGPGVYRVEVYRTSLGEPFSKMPWILSGPIYLR